MRAAAASLVLTVLASGCMDRRRQALDRDIVALKREAKELQQEADELTQTLAEARPATQAVRKELDDSTFDIAKPLPKGHPTRPDVILLSIDTLRADHLGAYGYGEASGRDTSPFLDQLADDGTLFEQAWSPTSWTLPSHTSMLSGTLPDHHGVIDDHLRIPPDLPMVQEAFGEAGYGTIGAVATLFVSSRFGFDRGFDAFNDFGVKSKAMNNLSTVDADHVFHSALHEAQQQPHGKPLFVFVHVYDAHYGYDAPPPYNELFDRPPTWEDQTYKKYHAYLKKGLPSAEQMDHQVAQYDEEIRYVDAMFEQLVTTWRASGRDLIVAVTADHGEEFGERGSWGHGHTLFPEQTHVPLIVNGPGIRTQRVPDRVGTEDIAPTLAELAGVPFRAQDGASRARQLRRGGPAPAGRSGEVAATYRFNTNVIRWNDGPWDLTVDLNGKKRMLCRLDTDPGCLTGVYKANEARGERMFSDWLRDYGASWTVRKAGELSVENGVAFRGTERGQGAVSVSVGDRITVIPGDALVKHRDAEGTVYGPWQPLGGTVPGAGCPMRYSGRYLVDARLGAKTAQERQMLIELGYLQEDGDDDVTMVSGPIPCEAPTP